MTVLILENNQKRRTLFWPVGGRTMPVAPGETFAVVDAEIAAVPGLRDALNALLDARLLIEAKGAELIRH